MQFTRLRLTGFKSFVDPTELMIEPGTTGVVGPNGCGKSNLVEALRWVMGETSAKKMRGGEMDDVIFNGTSDRPARNIAEVSLGMDNADRKAPAAFNDADQLEVARRIERSVGSRYLVNGSDVRARDVQLLFADAATGSNSSALVSQGHIGALINAKPQQRRSVLEEAAGIKGLASRRHEAELRLRAAEQNLARVDDVMQTLDNQLQALKRQARQASRYRNLSGYIRQAEAMMLHLRWQQAQMAIATARQRLADAEKEVTGRTGAAARATTEQADAAAALPPLRQTEAEAAAALQRLAVERDRLDETERRARGDHQRLTARLAQIDSDMGREKSLAHDASEALTRLAGEEQDITSAQAGEGEAMAAATAAATERSSKVSALDTDLQRENSAAAATEALRTSLRRQADESRNRLARLEQRLADTAREIARLEALAPADEPQGADIPGLQAAAQAARQAFEAAETARRSAATEEQATRETFRSADQASTRLRAEADALADLLAVNEDDLWPPLIDAVTVEPGYEAALGAALGDDLNVATDSGAPVHWRNLPPYDETPPLPDGVVPMGNFVRAPAVLQRRLSQIGLVDAEEGPALAAQLRQGQRLVTRDGALWRWDGFTAGANVATTAATRLNQRNRLKDLRAQLQDAEARASAAKGVFEAAHQTAATTVQQENEARGALKTADDDLTRARQAEAETMRRNADRLSKLQSQKDSATQTTVDRDETAARLQATEAELETLPPAQEAQQRIESLRNLLSEERRLLAAAEAERARLTDTARSRAGRVVAIGNERRSWQGRSEAAERQMAALTERQGQLTKEIAAVAAIPTEIAGLRSNLLTRLETADAARKSAADALATAEALLSERDGTLKEAQAALSTAREERVRYQGGVEQADELMKTVVGQVREVLDCTPEEALAKAEHDEGDPLPPLGITEQKLDRLKKERERMGAVNLLAEQEAQEIGEQLETLTKERDDLVAAIARLRQGISGLNKEGRERLLEAFQKVDTNFRELFQKLFGGGQAHLQLIDAEDPLEAGLEIMASPPGKRLQAMSLLSGGEQALTALCLLFAVFMVNPAPICVLDEVDAPLDESNVGRFCDLVDSMAKSLSTRFLIITHNSITMARMDRLYGVTMPERGVSQLVSVDLSRAERIRDGLAVDTAA